MASRNQGDAATGEIGQRRRRTRVGPSVAAAVLTIAGLFLTIQKGSAQAPRPAAPAGTQTAAQTIDLTNAVVVGPASPTVHEGAALQALVEEVEKRSIV